MLRQLSSTTRMLAIAATFALPTVGLAQADNRPVVVVFTFGNNSIGTGRADFEGISTGVQDLLITELASNSKIRLVDRAKINEIMQEQNLVKSGAVDPATAIRVGKLLGAQYAITGGFMSDGRGTAVITGRTIDMETSQIDPKTQKIQGKSDDVLGLISQLTGKITADLNLAPKPGAGRRGDAGDANKTDAKTAVAQSGQTKAAAPVKVEQWAKPVDAKVVEKTMKTKLDVATLKTYSNALDEMDKKNYAKAKELLKQVKDKYPEFEPAERNLKALGA
jgi:TolB-like protein